MNIVDQLIGFPSALGVQRTYQWMVFFPDLFGIFVSGIVVGKYCQGVRFGQYSISELSELKVGAKRKFFPNDFNIEAVTFNFVTGTPDLVTLYFSKWRSLIVDSLGRYSLPASYKKSIYVVFQARSEIPVNIARIYGAFPLNNPLFDLSYTQEAAVSFDIECRCDGIEYGVGAASQLKTDIVTSLS